MKVNTVTGEVEASQLGITLMHEHIYINLLKEYRETGLINQHDVMREELREYKKHGGMTIVEVTPAELTHGAGPNIDSDVNLPDYQNGSRAKYNVNALQRLAEETGVQIIMGTGHYRDPYLTELIDQLSVNQLAEIMKNDINNGFPGTTVKAGIIGEIGADKWYISSREERSFRAAARAQTATGVPITTHAARWPVGLKQLDLLKEEGVNERRVIIGHCDTVPILEYHKAVAQKGAFVQYDCIRGENAHNTNRVIQMIRDMIAAGYIDQLLLSHDVCTTQHLKSSGGEGYSYIPNEFANKLTSAGLSLEEVKTIIEINPRRVFSRH